jgi:uncharacterized protein
MDILDQLTALLGSERFWLFVVIGFVAQMFDGALGMGFGVISYTVLTMMGIDPKVTSATVNSAKIFTGGASTIGHLLQRNVDWVMLRRLAIGGVIGAMIGVFVLTQMPVKFLKITLAVYLLGVGAYIILSATSAHHRTPASQRRTLFIGGSGGFLEAVAGVWGPLVTSNMIASGSPPRYVIGTGNVAETAVAVAVTIALSVHVDLAHMATTLFGLVAGALVASPIAAKLTRKVPQRTLMISVGTLVIVTSLARIVQTLS